MIEAGFAWLGVAIFELVETIRHKATMSQGAWWALGRGRWRWLLVGLVGLLTVHLLWPLIHPKPVTVEQTWIEDEEG